jgi:hypothetical protein
MQGAVGLDSKIGAKPEFEPDGPGDKNTNQPQLFFCADFHAAGSLSWSIQA